MYVALKPMKVPTPNGVENRKPGDPVPEAANWKNLRNYISQSRIGHQHDYDAMMARQTKSRPAIVAKPEVLTSPETESVEEAIADTALTKTEAYNMCKELGLDVSRRNSKEELLELLGE